MLTWSPGAGKTQTLLWIRELFEDICGWTHGVEFVFGASQNTMAALIAGFTLHSFHKLSFKHKDGTTVASQNDAKNDMSSVFERYQALRFMFIDEFSTASLDVFAEIDNNTSTHIQERGTWALRQSKRTPGADRDNKRPFGGLNVITSGDAWHFGPVSSSQQCCLGRAATFINVLDRGRGCL